jgi:hypothetical protein
LRIVVIYHHELPGFRKVPGAAIVIVQVLTGRSGKT